jgi:hypothetical protein
MQTAIRPQLVSPRAAQTLEAVRSVTGGSFDVDAFHVMNARDDALIADEVLHGTASDKFVYHFTVSGTEVSGISVVGARHLANHYRGLKHRLVGSVQKTGALFEYRAFPSDVFAGDTRANVVPELASEPDFYSCVCEVTDLKTGNSIMVEAREERVGHSERSGDYDKPHYQKIAQSKAYRNAVLALIPQDVAIRWKNEMLKLKKGEFIAGGVIEEKRSNVLRFAAQRGVALDRQAIEHLTLDQIAGLGDAAREGQLPAFVNSARALGLEIGQGEAEPESATASPSPDSGPQPPARRGRGRPPLRAPREQYEYGEPPTQAEEPAQPPAGPSSAEREDEPPRRVQFEV